ncbi:hypothetical protein EA543_25305 [Salmonella enterica subsp. enterica serovar Poona]|nr:hypothetical protein [Salmonella enterica subsp. enterica serovar Poona]EAP4203229.1 hypothetical protein [Salmonella enterica subsp. enterica serovar Poona]EAR0439560.1 hypothetical protein [Salmonella enterica subsp. enterica serovar Poona]
MNIAFPPTHNISLKAKLAQVLIFLLILGLFNIMDVIGTTRSALTPDLPPTFRKQTFSQAKPPSFYVANLLAKTGFQFGHDFTAKALFLHV